MTLRRKMGFEIAAMIVALLLISAASLWGLNGLHQDFDSAIRGYQGLRDLYEISTHVATARTLLGTTPPHVNGALQEMEMAVNLGELFCREESGHAAAQHSEELRRNLLESLKGARHHLHMASVDPAPSDSATLGSILTPVFSPMANLAASIRKTIEEAQRSGEQKRQATMLLMTGLCAAVMVIAVAVAVMHYRGVITPLNRLSSGVRSIAAGRFSDRIEPQGHEEFVALGEDFNRMAGELDELYRELEQKVAAKSKELVRSERLASVGYLAAGVAHEVNNPIGIIAGHAELMLAQLRRSRSPEALAEAERTLELVCEEAFRCKEIVSRLLSLARPGEENRRRVDLGEIAAKVVATIGGLGEYRSRRVTLASDRGEELRVIASEGEMKQVVLNLAINALEATTPGEGEVRIEVRRKDEMVELAVIDNGRGMSEEVRERVFEPFFTAKRGSTHPGTGLGLSICHAIVESHGGTIAAQSEGLGKGSRFVVRLPAAPGERL